MQEKYIWKVEDIFETEADFKKAIEEVKVLTKEATEFKGKLHDPAKIFNCFVLEEQIGEFLEKVYAYAMLKFHENTANQKSIKRYKSIEDLYEQVSIATTFILPEIQKLSIEELRNLINKEPRLERFKRDIEEIIEEKPHILSEVEEQLMSRVSTTFGNCESIFDTLTDTDFKFPSIVTKDGETVELTHGSYIKFLESKDADIRRQAF